MNLELSPEALELGRVVRSAIESSGGDSIVRAAEATPSTRHELVDPLLGALGAWDLSPRRDALEREAAAEVCRAAGWFALPYPIAERLSRLDDDHDLAVVVAGDSLRANVDSLPVRIEAFTMDGRRAEAHPVGEALGTKLGSMVVALEVSSWRAIDDDAVSLPIVLSAWSLLGMTERAFDLSRRHVLEREQFGRRLADFQSVQFQLTDAAVALQGLHELAKYTLWSIGADPSGARCGRSRPAGGRPRCRRHRLPHCPPTPRSGRLLRRASALVAVTAQPTTPTPAARRGGHRRGVGAGG